MLMMVSVAISTLYSIYRTLFVVDHSGADFITAESISWITIITAVLVPLSTFLLLFSLGVFRSRKTLPLLLGAFGVLSLFLGVFLFASYFVGIVFYSGMLSTLLLPSLFFVVQKIYQSCTNALGAFTGIVTMFFAVLLSPFLGLMLDACFQFIPKYQMVIADTIVHASNGMTIQYVMGTWPTPNASILGMILLPLVIMLIDVSPIRKRFDTQLIENHTKMR